MKAIWSTSSPSSMPQGNSLEGTILPDFETQTTSGPIKFYEWAGDSWIIVFSCQGSYTPDTLLSIGPLTPELEKRNVKVLGISTAGLDSHYRYVLAVNNGYSSSGAGRKTFDIAFDIDKKICTTYKLVNEATISKTSKESYNTILLIDPTKVARLTNSHPASVAGNLKDILSVIDSIQSTQSQNSSTEPGENNDNDNGTNTNLSESGNASMTPDNTGKNTNVVVNAFKRIATFDTLSKVNSAVGPIWTSPYLENAVQVLEETANLGHTLPFVAPVFMIFKVIIQIEKRARDADEKCRDLVERITFMLSHITAIKNLEITEPTKHVIVRITEALKTCAALMEAYRGQRSLSRRLNFNNGQKFDECAQSLKSCTEDLLVSLQIHQTGKIEFLARAIPVDLQDQITQAFITRHGDIENIRNNPDLINEFARQQHLRMDDQAMQELNSNISDVIQRSHDSLERLLKDNVSTAVVDGIKYFTLHLDQAEMEQKLTCVQCGKEYRQSTNGENSCSYHKYPLQGKIYSCCSSSSPCQFNFHRSKHHCDYQYGSFFDYAYAIRASLETKEIWAEVNDTNLEEGYNTSQRAFVGRLARWSPGAEPINEKIIVVCVGQVGYSTPYFLDTFTSNDLVLATHRVIITGRTTIYRTSEEAGEFSMAEWILSDGAITGVRLSAKSHSSSSPFIRECPIDMETCTKSGEVVAISEGGLRSYRPDRPYELPVSVRVGPEISDKPIREPRTDFKSSAEATSAVMLLVKSSPPIKANVQTCRYDFDIFEGEISVFNNNPAGSSTSITISSIIGTFRFIGEKEYQPLQNLEIKNGSDLPVTIDPHKAWNFRFSAWVSRSQEDTKRFITWSNRAFGARHHPLRLKLTVQDIGGKQCSIVTEYVFEPFCADVKMPEDVEFFYIDNPDVFCRGGVHVRGESNNAVLNIGQSDITIDLLKRATYIAIKTGKTEVDLGLLRMFDGFGVGWQWRWNAWALVDLSCCRVYAIKVLLTGGENDEKKQSACLGYVAVPEYGVVINETRPIQYAVESIKLPELEPYNVPKYPQDDDLDDFVPEPPNPLTNSPETGTSSSGQLIQTEETSQQLASIDSNLSALRMDIAGINMNLGRIASTLEKLLAAKTD